MVKMHFKKGDQRLVIQRAKRSWSEMGRGQVVANSQIGDAPWPHPYDVEFIALGPAYTTMFPPWTQNHICMPGL